MKITPTWKSLLAAGATLLVTFLNPHYALAATSTPPTGLLQNLTTFGAAIGMHDTDPRLIVVHLIRIAMSFVGMILLIMILSSGFQWMTSGGNDEKIVAAKKTFFNAIIGIFIMLSAYSIVLFVTGTLGIATGLRVVRP